MTATVLLGDSLELLPSLGLFDLVVTDPPFAQRKALVGQPSWGVRYRKMQRTIPEYEMTEHVLAILTEAARHVAGGVGSS